MKRKILSILMAVVMIMAAMPVINADESATGEDGLTWTLSDDGTLTISGEGGNDGV